MDFSMETEKGDTWPLFFFHVANASMCTTCPRWSRFDTFPVKSMAGWKLGRPWRRCQITSWVTNVFTQAMHCIAAIENGRDLTDRQSITYDFPLN